MECPPRHLGLEQRGVRASWFCLRSVALGIVLRLGTTSPGASGTADGARLWASDAPLHCGGDFLSKGAGSHHTALRGQGGAGVPWLLALPPAGQRLPLAPPCLATGATPQRDRTCPVPQGLYEKLEAALTLPPATETGHRVTKPEAAAVTAPGGARAGRGVTYLLELGARKRSQNHGNIQTREKRKLKQRNQIHLLSATY